LGKNGGSDIMKKRKIFIPWNLPEYSALNGFHDLYDFLLEENKYFEFKTIETKNFYGKKYLKFLSFFNKFDSNFNYYNQSASTSFLLNKFASRSCQLDFLHTSPILATKGKPFIFHLEDFQSIFIHKDIISTFKKEVNLQEIFELESCLAIISHLPETLQSFRNYFNSPIINDKLHFSKIAISDSFIKSAQKIKNYQKDYFETVFLFTSSGHQNSNNYVTRGLKIVINFAQKLIKSNRKVKFIFKCIKLSKEQFIGLGLSEEQIDFIYNCPSIFWYEEYISDDDMIALYKMADFFLLPSAHLHSMSILKSMYCKAIPVVSDTIGTDQYVSHLENSIVLSGVKEAVFQDKISMLKSNIDNYLALEESLADQLFSNIVKIIDKPEIIEKMKLKAHQTVIENFLPKKNTDKIFHYILNQYQKKVNRKNNKMFHSLIRKLVNKIMLTSHFINYKQTIPQKVYTWENIEVIKHHSRYFLHKSEQSFYDLSSNILTFPTKSYHNIIDVSNELKKIVIKNYK